MPPPVQVQERGGRRGGDGMAAPAAQTWDGSHDTNPDRRPTLGAFLGLGDAPIVDTLSNFLSSVADGLWGFWSATAADPATPVAPRPPPPPRPPVRKRSPERRPRRYVFCEEGLTSAEDEVDDGEGDDDESGVASAQGADVAAEAQKEAGGGPERGRRKRRERTEAPAGLLAMLPDRPRAIALELVEETLSCGLCLDVLRKKSRVWACPQCQQILHLKCMRDLAAFAPSPTHLLCPCCRSPFDVASLATSRCFCGRTEGPPYHEYEGVAVTIPHCCEARRCGRVGRPTCTHPCPLPCHPGPCEKCQRGQCWCGAVTYTYHCWEGDPRRRCGGLVCRCVLWCKDRRADLRRCWSSAT